MKTTPCFLLLLVALCARADAAVPEAVKGVHRLTDPALLAHHPRFSPDGKKVVFHAGPDGKGDIYIVGTDGEGLTQLTKDPGDDRDPTFMREGTRIVWSAERGGERDLWVMNVDGSEPERLLALPGDETEPTVSPVRYGFLAIVSDQCAKNGASATVVAHYDKLAFTRRYKGKTEVWFASEDGAHKGRLSKAGQKCSAPSWSGSGIELSWACEGKGGSQVLDSTAKWDRTFSDALTAVGWDGEKSPAGPGCETEEMGEWKTDECLKKLPRRYAKHGGKAMSAPADGLAGPSYSLNRTLLLASGAGTIRYRPREGGEWKTLPLGDVASGAAAWSPDGKRIAFEGAEGDNSAIYLADTDFYLQDVEDLQDYPELTGAGTSERMQGNGFVARPGKEKEPYVLYEKIRYARRAPFVTADAVLQVFHDEFAQMLREAEGSAQADLGTLCTALFDHYSAIPASKATPETRHLAKVFGVAKVVLDAADQIVMPDPYSEEYGYEEAVDPADKVKREEPIAPVDQLVAAIPDVLSRLPAASRKDIEPLVDKLAAHEGVAELAVPGLPKPVLVDFSLAKVRGHYASSPLAGYFLAMTWLAVAPLPLDEPAFGLLDQLDSLQVNKGGPKGPTEPLHAVWSRIDALGSAFMGRPVDVTVTYLAAVRKDHPDLFAPKLQRDAVRAKLAELRGPIPFRGPGGAINGDEYPLQLTLFPKRYGLDVEVFKELTHPDVPYRPWPRALDVYAALGVPAAKKHALEAENGEQWYDAYKAALDTLIAKNGKRPEGYFATDLYHSWLAMLVSLASPLPLAPGQEPAFARTPAWHDRQLFSALAGYTQLKHDAVLYAFQDMSAECDSDRPVVTFIEQPELPTPRGYVDPNPAFFRGLAKLAGRVYDVLGGGIEPTVEAVEWAGYEQRAYDPEVGWPEQPEPKELASSAKRLAEKLARVAEQELKGDPLSDADVEWLMKIGPILEVLFLNFEATGHEPMTADEGRKERGVALVTDVHTNITRGEVLTEGVGRLMDLFVAVPGGVARHLTQGGLLSYYELTAPMSDRLTDEAWNERLERGDVPPLPAWTKSFVEPAPKAYGGAKKR